MSQYETLEVTQDGSVMIIALNRPEKMNTFNTALRREIAQAAIAANLDKTVSCLLYTSPSPRDVVPSRMPSSA